MIGALPRLPLAHPANLPGWQPCDRPADEPTTVRVLITGLAWPHAKLIHRHIGSEPVFSGKEWRLGSVNPQQIPSAIAEALANRQHVNLDLQAHFAPKR